MSDNRSVFTHLVHGIGHQANYHLKQNGISGIESTRAYRAVSPNKNNGNPWSANVDSKRADYHFTQASIKGQNIVA
jgi:hypothetical protein